MDDNYAFGANPATLREKYREAHDLIIKAWAEPDVFAWNGTYNKLRYVNIWPRPIQKPPPIWVPGGGSVETWDFCAEHGYNYSYLSFLGYVRGAQLMSGFWDRMKELGVEFNPYQAAFAQQICVAETDEQAQELYEPHVRYFFERCLHVSPRFADAPGYRTEATIRAGLANQLAGRQAAGAFSSTLSWKELVEQGFIVAGSPDSCAAQMETVARTLKVGHIVCLLHIGDMPTDRTMYNTNLFATRVMPQLRPLWSEYEDHWSPRPIPSEQMATPRPIQVTGAAAGGGGS
jgi:alkanesulfonate monooxygenase SsuD/methylene tetrahydromethanopterin reductase-like flavin-dependent oxidoreductase (luciferase family)